MKVDSEVKLKFCGQMSANECEKDKKDSKSLQQEKEAILQFTFAVTTEDVGKLRGQGANKIVCDEVHNWSYKGECPKDGSAKASTNDDANAESEE